MSRRRLNAFEVSFPEERAASANSTATSSTNVSRSSSVNYTSALGKRKSDGAGDPRLSKRRTRELPESVIYRKRDDAIQENEYLVLDGEDPDHEEDDDQKPVRELYDFIIFDPKHGNELVSLDALEQDDGVDRAFEAVGKATFHATTDEDDGQEDELEEEDGTIRKPQLVNLSAVLRCTVDNRGEHEPFYIETQYAWYILMKPHAKYIKFWEHFYTSRRIAQLVVSWALERRQDAFATFIKSFTSRVDMFGHTYTEGDLWNSLPEIQAAVSDEPEAKSILAAPFVRHLLRNTQINLSSRPTPSRGPRSKHLPRNKANLGNLDLAVLKAENQNTTHVTPRISELAEGLFRERIEVIGPRPAPINKTQAFAEKKRTLLRLQELCDNAKRVKKKIDYRKTDRIGRELDKFYKAVKIDGCDYSIGDVVLVPRQPSSRKKEIVVPVLGHRVHDHFWFARILYIVIESQTAHVQWFNHGCNTIMEELAHPQELFLSHRCDTYSLHHVVGKATVFMLPDANTIIKPEDYFCKFIFDRAQCTFTAIDAQRLTFFNLEQPPDNCLSCSLAEERELLKHARELKDENGVPHGVALGGYQYHLEDFVLYAATEGPAHIGYIVKIEFGRQFTTVTVRKVGRIRDLERILPEMMIRDERHLYLTDEKDTFGAENLLQVIYAPCVQSFSAPHATLEDWLKLSYDHFYLRYVFPTLKPKSWRQRRKLTWQELYVCTPCCKERLKGRNLLYEFLQQSESKLLPTLDLFGGVGAFSCGLAEGSGCLDVTHAIEIGPSAAKTFKRNSPKTIVYNQCANIMLRYAIKAHERQQATVPKQLYDGNLEVPLPPKPGEIKVITAGFPCQSHSSLNMFKKQDDVKSNLILTTLSYLDFYSPTYAYFENVPGFTRFHLQAQEGANKHNANGEVLQGGMKLLIRALIDMNYQVRIALLEAAHYGTPQRRERFFLVAAKEGHPIPELPQPTHDYPDAKDHTIKYGDDEGENIIRPIATTKGKAAHPFVTIEDAIGDLPRFDWKHPWPAKESPARREERRKRAETIPAKECKSAELYCGFRGLIGYFHEPRTTFQYQARLEPTTDIQHYTKCLIPKKVERVLNIPMVANADYRSLPANQYDWGIADPMAAPSRLNYRGGGAYGRLDGNGIFPTTVTNVDPTAKQCRVLHPKCHRMVTVRELARSQGFPDNFVFELAFGMNVVTLHRQIGNAVPIPVAHALGRQLRKSLFQRWKAQRDDAIVIDDGEDNHDNPRHRLQVHAHDDSDAMDIY